MQATLDDQNVSAGVLERHFAAVSDVQRNPTLTLPKQSFRKIDPFQILKAESLQGKQTVPPSTENLDDPCLSWPIRCTKALQPLQNLGNFLFGSFETEVGIFPNFVATEQGLTRADDARRGRGSRRRLI